MIPVSSISVNCFRSSESSGCDILYGARVGGFAPGTNSISWSTVRLGGRRFGMSCGMMSSNSRSNSFMGAGMGPEERSISSMQRVARNVGSCLFTPFFNCKAEMFSAAIFMGMHGIMQGLAPFAPSSVACLHTVRAWYWSVSGIPTPLLTQSHL